MRTLISGAGVGSGPALSGVKQILADSIGNTVYLLTADGLLYVNVPSGDRFVLSGEPGGVAAGPELLTANKMLLDEAKTACSSRDTTRRPALARSSRSPSVGCARRDRVGDARERDALGDPSGLAYDELAGDLYVSNWFGSGILRVDLASADREVLSGINPPERRARGCRPVFRAGR